MNYDEASRMGEKTQAWHHKTPPTLCLRLLRGFVPDRTERNMDKFG